MERLSFEIESRSQLGGSANNRLRRSGLLPTIVYSHGEPSIASSVNYRDFVLLASRVRSSQIFTLKSKDSSLDGKAVVVKDIQRDSLKGTLLHVDFQALKENEAISVRVPLMIKGEPVGVKLDGGILTVLFHEIGIRCLPRLIPDVIDLDVSALKVGQSLHASDLVLAEGVELDDDPSETLASVVMPKAVEEVAAPAAGEAVAAEGEAAAGAAAPAAGAPAEAAKAAPGKPAK